MERRHDGSPWAESLRPAGRAMSTVLAAPTERPESVAIIGSGISGLVVADGLHPRARITVYEAADWIGGHANTVDVDAPGFDPTRLQRSFYTTSSCGVCGKGALDAVAVEAPRVTSELRMPLALVSSLPDRLREAQAAFALTGGLHATGLFTPEGELLCVREDVGRHNALDKVIGWAFGAGRLPLGNSVLCVSGRLSFELVQKAVVAGCPIMVAVGAPSSLAVELAADRGVTLCGFVRGGTANVYTEQWRITG